MLVHPLKLDREQLAILVLSQLIVIYNFSIENSSINIPLQFLGGGLLICELILNEDKSGPVFPLLQSLNMLVATGGRERTASEYKQLLEKHGFVDVQVKPVHPTMAAILCRKM